MNNLLSLLKNKKIHISIEDNDLVIKAPKGALDSDLIEQVRSNKQDLINFLKGITNFSEIPKTRERELYRLSGSQKRLWVLDQFDEENITYNIPASFLLEGELQTTAFNSAYTFMLNRHESLRTVFITVNGEPKQHILDSPDFNIDIINLRNSMNKEEEARSFAEKDMKTSFNLEIGPLVRFTVLRLEDEKSLILFNMHHIISDGWSINIFTSEFLEVYNSFSNDNTPNMEPLRIQYKDFSAWQNALLDSSNMDIQKDYWLDKLSGEIPVLNLPSDRLRPATQTFNGNSIGFSLSKEISLKLNNLCLESKASLFMILQSITKTLLYRYTGQNDIILGSPIAGRRHEDLENQIGFYVNTLVYRDSINSDLEFNDLVQAVKKTCIDAFDNQDYPFDALVEDLDIKRDLSRSPLFDVMLVLQNNETTSVDFNGLNTAYYETKSVISKFDMTFNFSENDGELYCGIEYNTDIYSDDRIVRMIEHFKTLVLSVLANPESKIKDIEIIPEEEKNLLLNVFNDTKVDYPKDKTIVDLFEEQVEKTPDNIAVVFEHVELTYRELNEKANIVGHYLRDNYDIKPDDLVGVLLNRSEKMIIALLGILKSGAAYVPIDPEYPQDRIEYMLKDSSPKAVLCENEDLSVNGINISLIDEVLKSGKSIDNPEHISKPNNLAYVIYTSGSTGLPKGSLITNNNYYNYICWAKKYYLSNTHKGHFGLFTSLSFDLTTTSIYLTLLLGKSLTIFNHNIEIHEILNDIFSGKVIDSVKLTPSHINVLREMKIKNNNIHLAIVGGEELLIDQVKVLKNINSEMTIINEYGPTEVTVGCVIKHIDDVKKKIVIGKPISNTSAYILDVNLSPFPKGVPGELYLSGKGLARGYLNRPELTAERFVENPFVKGERMYKTGDLARWLPDGNIEFLGRIDNQVKIRGFRIELGEIENSLIKHQEISSVVVQAKASDNGDKYLVAYYVSTKEILLSNLRRFLGKSLPDYMVPSYFVFIDELPLTPNGKIDRNALPEPNGTINTGMKYIAPRNSLEMIIVKIWNDVLFCSKPPGIDENFFELGGDSIKAIQIMARLSQEGFKGDIASLFNSPTIREFALLVKENKIIIDQSSVTGQIPLTPIQKWFFDDFDCPKHHFNQAVMLDLKDSINDQELVALKTSARELIKHHDALRINYALFEGTYIQENMAESELYFEEYDLRGENHPAEKIEKIATGVQSSFNLEEDTLIRFVFFNLEDGARLLIVSHHLIIDGVSWRILVEDLESGFMQTLKGNIIKLPLKTSSFKNWSETLNEYAGSIDFKKESLFWADIDSRRSVILPEIEYTKKREKVYSRFSLSQEETEIFLTKTNEAYNTQINDILLTALFRALSKWSGEKTISIDLESHGRSERFEDIDLSRTIGWFTSISPVLLEGANSDDIGEDIISVKEILREIPDNGIGYGIYKYSTVKNHDSFRDIKPEILFNYLGQFDTDMDTELFGMASDPTGESTSSIAISTHALNFNGMVILGQFSMALNSDVYSKEIVESILRFFKDELIDVLVYAKDKILLNNKLKSNNNSFQSKNSQRIRI